MANFKKHVMVGTAVAGGANLIYQLTMIYSSTQRPESFLEALTQVKWGRVAVFAAAGAAIAALPDLLEPAHHPNHRSLFHSICCGEVLAYGAFGKHSERWRDDDRHAVRVGAVAYLSHLFLDAGTPKSLPFIA
jgi:inner membrane protein